MQWARYEGRVLFGEPSPAQRRALAAQGLSAALAKEAHRVRQHCRTASVPCPLWR